ncbi:MAG: ABC transporter ATP-binding protein [Lachnospiraceae bacterium]
MKTFGKAVALDLQGFLFYLILNGLGWIVFSFLDYGSNNLKAKAIAKMNNELRVDITEQLVVKNFQDYRSRSTGDYMSWYISDVSQAENLGFDNFFNLCSEILSFTTAAVMLFYYHWSLLVAAFVVAGAIFLSSKKMEGHMQNQSEKVSGSMELFSERIKELISGLFLLRSFGLVPLFKQESKKESESLEESKRTYTKYQNKSDVKMSIIQTVGNFSTTGLMFLLILKGILATEVIFGGGNIIGTAVASILSLGKFKLRIASAQPYFEKLDYMPEKTGNRKKLEPIIEGILFENISYNYGEKQVLENLNIEFKKNEKYALMGPSGSGKTTIFKVLLGYLDDYNGKILFDHKEELRTIDPDSIFNQVAYIEQEVFLFNRSIRDNITLMENYEEKEIVQALRDSALDYDMEKFPDGLDTIVGRKWKESVRWTKTANCNCKGPNSQKISFTSR